MKPFNKAIDTSVKRNTTFIHEFGLNRSFVNGMRNSKYAIQTFESFMFGACSRVLRYNLRSYILHEYLN